MSMIRCPAPDCDQEFPCSLDTDVLTRLIDIHARTAHPSAPAATVHSAKAEKVKRPTISSAGTSEEWAYFVQRWADYKAATNLQPNEIIYQLLECCDEPLRKDLTRTFGSMSQCDEKTVMTRLRSLAVREENVMVARVRLQSMRQDRDEPVRAFAARLKGQASVCQYNIKCTRLDCNADISYCDEIVHDSLIRGLYDEDIRLDVLGLPHLAERSLDETICLIEAKESGKRSASRLVAERTESLPSTITAATSSYRKQNKMNTIGMGQKQSQYNQLSPSSGSCNYCGKIHNVPSSRKERAKICPAYGHVCSKCGISHHFELVCRNTKFRQNNGRNKEQTTEGTTAVFDTLCSVDSIQSTNTSPIQLEHHVYDDLYRAWVQRPSAPQPFVNVEVQALPNDIKEIGHKPLFNQPTPQINVSIIADTGCQSCLAGTSLLTQLGLDRQHTIPCTMRMSAANENPIEIVGALPLRIHGKSEKDKTCHTRQLVYITPSTDKFFLSKQACIDLGMIDKAFPSIGIAHQAPCNVDDSATNNERPCSCPKRELPPPRPMRLPYPPTEENRVKIEKWLIEYYSSSTFNTCEHQQLPMMTGPPMRLMVDPEAKPVAYHTPIPVPIHWQEEVKAALEQDVRLGVIEPVPIGTPVTWCHRMVVCAKKSGKPRRTVDLQPLNKHATRETHHTQSPFHQVRTIPAYTRKTVFDAWNGYHSIPLHEEDRHFTTFITPWGRYRYRVAPQGYIASGDAYTHRFDGFVADINDKTKVIDDTLLWSYTSRNDNGIEKSFFQAVEWLDRCGKNGVVGNPSKFSFAKTEVDFAGFTIGSTTVCPCKSLLKAIENFPTPQNVTDIRSLFGLINQVSYAFSSSEKLQPFRDFLKPNVKFEWTQKLQTTFEDVKKQIIKEIQNGVEIFDKSRPTCLATDWSKDGIGFWLFQKHCFCPGNKFLCCKVGWRIVLVGSRFTSSAESRYAPIEGEALAVIYALDKSKHFVIGCPNLIIAVDHKPLLKIFNDQHLDNIPNPRLRNLKEKALRYRFTITHIPGVNHRACDTLSRYPVGKADHMQLQDDLPLTTKQHQDFLSAIRNYDPPTSGVCSNDSNDSTIIESISWDDIRIVTNSDPVMIQLLNSVEDGFPANRNELPEELRPFHQYRDHLSSFDGVVLYRDRIVIPKTLRCKILETLHSAHQGISQMCSRAEASFFWPGMTADITYMRQSCRECNRIAPSQPSMPPTPPIQPTYPFQAIVADFFTFKGHHYLVIVDRYSNWPIVEETSNGSDGLIRVLRRTFVTYGIAEELSSDGGPEFTSTKTQSFLHSWRVNHRLSSVAYPHSNCRAEIGVKTVKRMLADNTPMSGSLDTDSFQRAMLQYRNTPDRDTSLSPAMCIFGRPIRDFIPIHPGKYKPHPTWQQTLIAREEALRNRHMRDAERLSEHTINLPALKVGDQVRIQNQVGPHPNKWDKTGTVIEVRQFNQYVVRVDGSGRVTLRNRQFLRRYNPVIERRPIIMFPGTNKTLPTTSPTPTLKAPYNPPHPALHQTTTPTENSASTPEELQQLSTPGQITLDTMDTTIPLPAITHQREIETPKEKLPRALARLLPHNKHGKEEALPLGRHRRQRNS